MTNAKSKIGQEQHSIGAVQRFAKYVGGRWTVLEIARLSFAYLFESEFGPEMRIGLYGSVEREGQAEGIERLGAKRDNSSERRRKLKRESEYRIKCLANAEKGSNQDKRNEWIRRSSLSQRL